MQLPREQHRRHDPAHRAERDRRVEQLEAIEDGALVPAEMNHAVGAEGRDRLPRHQRIGEPQVAGDAHGIEEAIEAEAPLKHPRERQRVQVRAHHGERCLGQHQVEVAKAEPALGVDDRHHAAHRARHAVPERELLQSVLGLGVAVGTGDHLAAALPRRKVGRDPPEVIEIDRVGAQRPIEEDGVLRPAHRAAPLHDGPRHGSAVQREPQRITRRDDLGLQRGDRQGRIGERAPQFGDAHQDRIARRRRDAHQRNASIQLAEAVDTDRTIRTRLDARLGRGRAVA